MRGTYFCVTQLFPSCDASASPDSVVDGPALKSYVMSWNHTDDALHRDFKFADFRQAFAFMTEVAFAAEAANHHPDWSNVYDTVRIRLTTHDAGNTVTDKDRRLAEAIDGIFARYA